MAQKRNAAGIAHLKRRRELAQRVANERRPPGRKCRWQGAYRPRMSDGPSGTETWGSYLRRMTSRPGWSVARLAREASIHRGTIFKWMKGETGVTVASVRAVAQALGDDPANALRAAGSVSGQVDETDEEVELVRTDPNLSADMKLRITRMILERRERERLAALEETRRLIELFGQEDSA